MASAFRFYSLADGQGYLCFYSWPQRASDTLTYFDSILRIVRDGLSLISTLSVSILSKCRADTYANVYIPAPFGSAFYALRFWPQDSSNLVRLIFLFSPCAARLIL